MTDQKRNEDGVLIVPAGRHYTDPGEAIVRHWAGGFVPTCTERVFGDWSSSPCKKAPKHDPDANGRMTKCGTHSQAAKDRRKAASKAQTEKWQADWRRNDAIKTAEVKLEPALREIAAGHNDARGLAQRIIAELDAARGQQ